MSRLRVAIETIGCRANQADSAGLVELFDGARVEIVSDVEQADVVIVNTCCVTAEAERDCRKTARRALSGPRSPQVWLVGCAANAIEDLCGELAGVEVLRFERATPEALLERIQSMAPAATASTKKYRTEAESDGRMLGRTRALLKIQTGCSHGCAYCIVPTARGPEKSVAAPEVLERAAKLVERGFREIVLTGVQLGAWGIDLPGRPRLAELLPRLADAVAPGRLRLSSIEPWHFGTHLVEAATGHPRICAHYHLPLQSGDDAVLAAMGRGYTTLEYENALNAIRARRPDAAIGTDVLLGLPGEDQASFEKTLALLERLRPTHIHAFSYSPRKGTRAAHWPGRPGRDEAKRRVRIVRELAAQLQHDFAKSQLGQQRQVIVEDVSGPRARGLSDNFLPVELEKGSLEAGALVVVRFEGLLPSGRLMAVSPGIRL